MGKSSIATNNGSNNKKPKSFGSKVGLFLSGLALMGALSSCDPEGLPEELQSYTPLTSTKYSGPQAQNLLKNGDALSGQTKSFNFNGDEYTAKVEYNGSTHTGDYRAQITNISIFKGQKTPCIIYSFAGVALKEGGANIEFLAKTWISPTETAIDEYGIFDAMNEKFFTFTPIVEITDPNSGQANDSITTQQNNQVDMLGGASDFEQIKNGIESVFANNNNIAIANSGYKQLSGNLSKYNQLSNYENPGFQKALLDYLQTQYNINEQDIMTHKSTHLKLVGNDLEFGTGQASKLVIYLQLLYTGKGQTVYHNGQRDRQSLAIDGLYGESTRKALALYQFGILQSIFGGNTISQIQNVTINQQTLQQIATSQEILEEIINKFKYVLNYSEDVSISFNNGNLDFVVPGQDTYLSVYAGINHLHGKIYHGNQNRTTPLFDFGSLLTSSDIEKKPNQLQNTVAEQAWTNFFKAYKDFIHITNKIKEIAEKKGHRMDDPIYIDKDGNIKFEMKMLGIDILWPDKSLDGKSFNLRLRSAKNNPYHMSDYEHTKNTKNKGDNKYIELTRSLNEYYKTVITKFENN